jgi:glycosyltransferase involved in cell wall biosynthesis
MLIGIDASRAFVKDRTGTENYSYQLIRAIAKIDRKNKYILFTRFPTNHFKPGLVYAGDPVLQALPENFTIKNIPLKRLWTQVGLAKELFFNPTDVLFIPAHTLPLIRKPRLKTVVTIHDLGYEYLPQYHKFPHKFYLNKSTEYAVWQSDHLIAVSEATKKDLINKLRCQEKKISVIYEGFDRAKFFPDKSSKTDKPFILFVGTLQPRKNIERLIEAFSLVVRSLPSRSNSPKPPDLVIAGNKGWMYDEILSAPAKFGVLDKVKFLGYTKEDDLPALYSGALVFCLPSLFEGFGLPVLEAMACGCPVIVSKTSSLPEVVGEAGIYVDPLDVSDIAKNLQSLIMNFKLREKLSKKSLEQAKKFSWEKAAKETIGVLERTIFLPSAP